MSQLLSPNFPIIEHLDQILPHVQGKKEIYLTQAAFGTRILSYHFMDSKTFESPWLRECRGLVFDRDGLLVSRPLHKFFNAGEKTWTRLDALPLDQLVSVEMKRDGSMIQTVNIQGRVELKSKLSFESDVARLARAFYDRPENANYRDFCGDCIEQGLTAVFEYTAPGARIVVKYPKEELRLLRIRRNREGTYLSEMHTAEVAAMYNVPRVERWKASELSACLDALGRETHTEGLVLRFAGDDMVKVKSPWYLRMHTAISFLRDRDVARAALNGSGDDLVAALVEAQAPASTLDRVREIESQVLRELLLTEREVAGLAEPYAASKDYKLAAEALKSHPLAGLVMRVLRGQTIDFKDWYMKNRLKEQWAPVQIEGFTVSEG